MIFRDSYWELAKGMDHYVQKEFCHALIVHYFTGKRYRFSYAVAEYAFKILEERDELATIAREVG